MNREDDIISYLEKVQSTIDVRAERAVTLPAGDVMSKRTLWGSLKTKIENFLGETPGKNVLLMPGLRGTGKTTLLFQLYLHYRDRLQPGNIIYLECDRITGVINTTLPEVLKVYEEKFLRTDLERLDEKVIILIDEAHYQKDWAPVIKSFSDRSTNIFFIVTGSSSLSLETNTDLVRRSSTKKMFPLSFSEYLTLKGKFNSDTISNKLYEACFNDLPFKERKDRMISVERDFRNHLPDVGNLDIEIEDYLLKGGFPFTMYQEEREAFEDLFDVSKRVIREDLIQFSDISTGSIEKVLPILRLIACSSREISLQTIAESVEGISPHTVAHVLETLKKAGMIYIFEPYGSTAKKIISKSPRYYMASPNIQASFQWITGRLYRRSSNMGMLLETAVADSLHRISAIHKEIDGCWYDYKKGGADFIVDMNNGERIVVEVGWGKKDSTQAINTLKRTDGDRALVISKRGIEQNKVEVKGKEAYINFIPKELFMMI